LQTEVAEKIKTHISSKFISKTIPLPRGDNPIAVNKYYYYYYYYLLFEIIRKNVE